MGQLNMIQTYIFSSKNSCDDVNLMHSFMWRFEVFISNFDSSLCRSIALGDNLQGIINSTN